MEQADSTAAYEQMKKTIENIISGVKSDLVFDSHYIIDSIILHQNDIYLQFAVSNPARTKITEYVHGEIAKIIQEFEGTLIRRQKSTSISYNIRGKASECALWKKI